MVEKSPAFTAGLFLITIFWLPKNFQHFFLIAKGVAIIALPYHFLNQIINFPTIGAGCLFHLFSSLSRFGLFWHSDIDPLFHKVPPLVLVGACAP
jgi:hypothetical protein